MSQAARRDRGPADKAHAFGQSHSIDTVLGQGTRQISPTPLVAELVLVELELPWETF